MAGPARGKPVSDERALKDALARPEYTPAVRDLPAVLAVLEKADDAPKVEANAARALGRIERRLVVAAITARLADRGAIPPLAAQVRLVRALGQLGKLADDAAASLVNVLEDAKALARVRREAAVALGKVGGEVAQAALLGYLDTPELAADHRRSVVEALGKLGGAPVLARLQTVEAGADAELERRRQRAVLMIERDGARDVASHVRMQAPLPADAVLVARCRDGLAPLLTDELRSLGLRAEAVAPGAVRVTGARNFAVLLGARTWLTIGIPVPLPVSASAAPEATADAIANTLATPATVALLTALTDGPVRWRLDIADAGHRRGLVWRTAERVRAQAPTLKNDPSQTTWDVVALGKQRELELRPRRFDDPRFAWRTHDVPAASHPTIAAALALMAGARDTDIVWDPFCGSGAELVERALRGKARSITGTDINELALTAARANAAAAGFTDRIEFRHGDARTSAPAGASLIISNPPLGRRLRGDVTELLMAFARHAATALVPGGRLVWLTPIARQSDALLRTLGMRLDRDIAVDLGGFDAPMQRWIKVG